MMTELAVRMADVCSALHAAVDELRPTQYTKEMTFQNMRKVTARWAKAILVFLLAFTSHGKCLKYQPKSGVLEMLNFSGSAAIQEA
jgi:Holliday junction resolvasome RuvABC endonuclease subunit